jgi:hypothetical protein
MNRRTFLKCMAAIGAGFALRPVPVLGEARSELVAPELPASLLVPGPYQIVPGPYQSVHITNYPWEAIVEHGIFSAGNMVLLDQQEFHVASVRTEYGPIHITQTLELISEPFGQKGRL